MKTHRTSLLAAVVIAGLFGWIGGTNDSQPASAAASYATQAQFRLLQAEVSHLNARLGNGPAQPSISVLLDQLTSYVNCLKQSTPTVADPNVWQSC